MSVADLRGGGQDPHLPWASTQYPFLPRAFFIANAI